jgi:hypothetical protein
VIGRRRDAVIARHRAFRERQRSAPVGRHACSASCANGSTPTLPGDALIEFVPGAGLGSCPARHRADPSEGCGARLRATTENAEIAETATPIFLPGAREQLNHPRGRMAEPTNDKVAKKERCPCCAGPCAVCFCRGRGPRRSARRLTRLATTAWRSPAALVRLVFASRQTIRPTFARRADWGICRTRS